MLNSKSPNKTSFNRQSSVRNKSGDKGVSVYKSGDRHPCGVRESAAGVRESVASTRKSASSVRKSGDKSLKKSKSSRYEKLEQNNITVKKSS